EVKDISNLGSGSIIGKSKIDTDTLESEGARFFRASPKNIADVAEKLYNNGFITYPRTESSFYLEKDLTHLVKEFKEHSEYGQISVEVISIGNTANPSKGKFSKDHEPIRPAKSAEKKEITKAIKGNPWQKELAWRIYNYVVLRFFATVHKDGKLTTRTMEIDVRGESFVASGTTIIEKGFLSIYPFRRIQESTLPPLSLNQETPLSISKVEGWTQPPSLWTEASIIKEMARQGIGTDATRSTHLATVNTRGFVTVEGRNRSLIPTSLGLAFYEVFTEYAPELIHPAIRGKIEGLTLKIREQEILPIDVDFEVINILKQGFKKLKKNQDEFFPLLAQSGLESGKNANEGNFGNCPSCKTALDVMVGKNQKRFLACKNSECKTSFPLPQKGKLQPLEKNCPLCNMKPLRVGTGTKAWVVCPSCWINKATKNDTLFFCSVCKEETCEYSSTKPKKSILGELGNCPECGGKVILKLEGIRTQVLCQSCQKEWKAPNLRRGTKITIGRECRLCNLQVLQITRSQKSSYFLCPICGEFCFNCKYKCFD
ncbi:MAG: DNA topoisomerase, partial [Promethearchaeota archaeon]